VKKILLFGYQSPPVFGPSVVYETLLRSEFVRHFDVTFINLSVVQNIRELETFRWGKLFKLIKFFLLELWYLLTRRFDVCCYPISYNRRAFLKDRVLLGLARLFGVPVVIWAHGTGAQQFREAHQTLAQAKAVLVLADCLHAEFAGIVPPERIHTITLGIDQQPIPPTASDGGTLLYLGGLVKAKGIFDLLEALPHVPAARLVVAGEWFNLAEQAAAKEFIRQHNLGSRVQFVGPVTGTAKWRLFSQADIFVFPPHSRTEAFGIVLLEAMQAGLPIVTTRGGARDEIVTDGINGLLVAEQTPHDLAAKLGQLLASATLRQQIGAANRAQFSQVYTQAGYAQRLITVFEKIAQQPKH